MVHIIAKNSRDNMTNENEPSYKRVCVCGRVFFDRVRELLHAQAVDKNKPNSAVAKRIPVPGTSNLFAPYLVAIIPAIGPRIIITMEKGSCYIPTAACI